MSKTPEVLKLVVNDKQISFKVLQKPQLISRSKRHKSLEKTSNPKNYRLLISKQQVQHHFHKFRTIFFDINSLDILISFNIKTKNISSKLYLQINDFFYFCDIEPDHAFLELIESELNKKNFSLKP